METELSLKEIQKKWHGSLRSYVIGFAASLILTSLSFVLVVSEHLTGSALIYTISFLAVLQAAVQLRYFLHLGEEEKPHWETFIFLFMLLILVIITVGSLWVMHDLKTRTMTNHTEMGAHD